MVATPLCDQGRGAVFFQTTNVTAAGQNWQIFPFNSSVYVFRAKSLGAEGYLTTFASGNDQTEFWLRIADSTLTYNSAFWYINS